jgi:elongation of very long chain fatty acids protein 7
MQMARAVWLYYMAKVVELLDTVFFVLRKKQSQVSFLHLYHHTLMPICAFIGLKYFAGKEYYFLKFCGCNPIGTLDMRSSQ